jgi:glutathione S-transferase
MPKPEIIGSMRSSYTRAVCLVCEEKRVEYVLRECALGAPGLFAIHPFGKMPVMRHGDFELCESKAIASYLDRSFPGPLLFPVEPRLEALAEQWISLVKPPSHHFKDSSPFSIKRSRAQGISSATTSPSRIPPSRAA